MSYIEDIMGFNPSDLDVFQEPTSQSNSYDANIYKTNPVKLSKSEDMHYRSKIRLLYAPQDPKKSIVKQETYFIQDVDGSLLVRSKLSNNDRECPIFKSWKKLWYSGDEASKEWAKNMYDKTASQWCLIQVMEDENQPELVGKILAWKLPKTIFTKMSAKTNPSAESKKAPIPVMDYLIGLPLDLDIAPGPDDPKAPERRQREISYDLCEFSADYMPIMKVDGTPLFDENELDIIDNYVNARTEVNKARSAAKKEAAMQTIQEITPSIKELYKKALDYMSEYAIDLEAECGYQEWDEATTKRVNRWIKNVSEFKDPKITFDNEQNNTNAGTQTSQTRPPQTNVEDFMNIPDPIGSDDDLPF